MEKKEKNKNNLLMILKNYLLKKNDFLVSNDNKTRNKDIYLGCNKGVIAVIGNTSFVQQAMNLYFRMKFVFRNAQDL